MIRTHMQRWGWNVPGNASTNVPVDDKENSDRMVDETSIMTTLVENDANQQLIITTGSMPDENDIVSPLNHRSLRRSSEGSDGLLASTEKENRTDLRSPGSPFAATRRTSIINRASPLRVSPANINNNNTLQQSNFSLVQSPKTHLSFSFDEKKKSTFSTISTISPKQKCPIQRENILNTDYSSSNYCGDNHDAYSGLYTLQEIVSNSSGEESLQTNKSHKEIIIAESLSGLSVASLGESSNTHKKYQASGESEGVSVSGLNNSKPDIVETFSIPHQESLTEEEKVTTTPEIPEDPIDKYKWAYTVWKRKGLMSSINEIQTKDNVNPFKTEMSCRLKNHATTHLVEKKSHYQEISKFTMKPSNIGFSNVLEQWKSKTEDHPTRISSSSSTIEKVPTKLYNRESYTKEATRSIATESKIPNDEVKPKLETFEKNATVQKMSIMRRSLHPSASIPIERKPSPRDNSPIRSNPKSQAWKLKAAHQIKIQQENKDLLLEQYTKKAPTEKGGDMNKSLCESTNSIHSNSTMYSSSKNKSNNMVTLTPMTNTNMYSPQRGRHSITSTANCKSTSSSADLGTSMRSKSQPRPRQTYRTTAMKNIYENTCTESPITTKFTRSIDDSKVPTKVMDLDISHEGRKSLEGMTIDIASDDSSEFFSPYTQRLMRNLAKVYNIGDDIKTPRGSATSIHPWQQDRLLSRVGSFVDESTQESGCQCSCSNSIFSGSDDLIDFFLPLMGKACVCGKKVSGLVNPNLPTALVNILRPWQVDFLSRFGINNGDELVKAFHRSGMALARAMIKFRKQEELTPYPLKSCVMALQIWAKTSKTFVRSIRDQIGSSNSGTGSGEYAAIGQSSVNTDIISDTICNDGTTAKPLKVPNTLYILSSFMDKVTDHDDHGGVTNNTNVSADIYRTLGQYSIVSPSNNNIIDKQRE